MVLYNVTVSIDKGAEAVWLEWMKGEHVPKVMGTGMFVERKIFKLLSHAEEDSVTYAVQYFAESIDRINKYEEKHAGPLQAEHVAKFKDRFVAFRTLLERVDG